ncbi:MAG: glycosyltransferase family 2 protein [Eubacteriales bacterium]|nr:glycosyltransferase family 2 protein [Eubacteriales bacterium]
MAKYFKQRELKAFATKLLINESVTPQNKSVPRISVITPSFNQGDYLEETILSVLNQNYPNLEYIIIDGGSTDQSLDIIRKYEKYLTYWISETDQGQAHAICKGFGQSNGEILAWLNSDDLYLPNSLNRIAQAYNRYPQCSFYYGHCLLIDKDTLIKRDLYTYEMDYVSYLIDQGNLFQGACFWKREIYDKYGPINIDLQFAMEYQLFDLFFMYEKPKFINEFVAAFRVHERAKSTLLKEVGISELTAIRGVPSCDRITPAFFKAKRYWRLCIDGNMPKKLLSSFCRRKFCLGRR